MFVDIFEKACESVGVAPTRLLADLGIGKSATSNWKNGHEPSNRTKKQIADYFGVTVSEFMEGKTKKLPSEGQELSEQDKQILEGFRELTEERQKLILAQIDAWKLI